MPGPGSRKSIEPDSPLVVAAGDPRRAFKESSLRYQIAARTCTIEDAAGWCGTGILVGPRHVLTNHHVIRDLLRPGADTGKTFCRFDYVKDTPTGKIYNGTQLFLRPEKWCYAFSPFSAQDDRGDDHGFGANELDYAILVLKDDIGLSFVSEDRDGPIRAWMELTSKPPAPGVGMPLRIWQHPSRPDVADAGPLQDALGIGDGKVLRLLDGGLRLRHDVPTRKGSSGAPCFDETLRLAAIHNAGDPGSSLGYRNADTKTERGQAIPLYKIVEDLLSQGKDDLIDANIFNYRSSGGRSRKSADRVDHRLTVARLLMDRRTEEIDVLYAISQGRLVHVLVCGGSDSHVDFLTRLELLSFPCQLSGMPSAAERHAFLRGDAKDLKKWDKNSLSWPPSNLPPEEALKRIQFELNDMDTSKPMYLESFVEIDSCDPARDCTLIAQLAKHCLDTKFSAARFQIFIVYYDGSPTGAGRQRMSAFSWKPAQVPDGCGQWAPFMPIRAGDLNNWRIDIAAAWNVDEGTLDADIASYFPDNAAFPMSVVQKRLLPLMQKLAEQSLPKE